MRRCRRLLVLLAGLCGAACATITHVANDAANFNTGGTSSITITVGSTTVGSLLVVVVSWFPNGGNVGATGVTSGANTFTRLYDHIANPANASDHLALFYLPNNPGGLTSITVAASGGAYINAGFSEYTGVAASSPVDGTSVFGTGSNTTSCDSGAFTPGASGDLLIGTMDTDAGGQTGLTAGGGATIFFNQLSSTTEPGGASWLILSGSGATHMTWTWTKSDSTQCGASGFLAAAGSSPTPAGDIQPFDNSTMYQQWQSGILSYFLPVEALAVLYARRRLTPLRVALYRRLGLDYPQVFAGVGMALRSADWSGGAPDRRTVCGRAPLTLSASAARRVGADSEGLI